MGWLRWFWWRGGAGTDLTPTHCPLAWSPRAVAPLAWSPRPITPLTWRPPGCP